MTPLSSISVNLSLALDADTVWLALRDPSGPALWDESVAFIDIADDHEGGSRTMIHVDGSRSIERIEEVDDGRRSIRFSTVYTTVPLENRMDRITVNSPEGGRCVVTWVTGFVVPDGDGNRARRELADQNMACLRSLQDWLAANASADLSAG